MTCPVCGHAISLHSGVFISASDRTYVPMCNTCGIKYGHSCLTCRHQQAPAPQCLYEKYDGPLDVIQMVCVSNNA